MKKKILQYLVTGTLGLLPLVISIYILITLSQWTLALFSNVSSSQNPFLIIFSGVVSFLFVLEFGRQLNNKKQNAIVNFSERVLAKFPILDKVITVIKDFTNMLQGKGKFEGLGVAKVPFAGGRTNGLITNVVEDEEGIREYTVFIVTGTFPPTGFVSYYKSDEIELREDMSAKDVFELQITLGIKG